MKGLKVALIFVVIIVYISARIKNKSVMKEAPQRHIISQYDSCYNEAIIHLKRYEGFNKYPYIDASGHWTIGYGHQIINKNHWKDSISETLADSLLRSDLNKRIKRSRDIYGLSQYRALAIGLFIFNCGSYNYNKSTLKRLVDNNLAIDKEIIKWCHYKRDSIIFQNKRMRERRVYELKLYNYGLVQINEETEKCCN